MGFGFPGLPGVKKPPQNDQRFRLTRRAGLPKSHQANNEGVGGVKLLIVSALLAIALVGMWYKGQLDDHIELRPEQLGLPSVDQLSNMGKLHLLPEQRDLSQAVKDHQRAAKVDEFIVQDTAHKPMALDEAVKTGDMRAWAQSHQVPEERSEIDKLLNFFARGKYE